MTILQFDASPRGASTTALATAATHPEKAKQGLASAVVIQRIRKQKPHLNKILELEFPKIRVDTSQFPPQQLCINIHQTMPA